MFVKKVISSDSLEILDDFRLDEVVQLILESIMFLFCNFCSPWLCTSLKTTNLSLLDRFLIIGTNIML